MISVRCKICNAEITSHPTQTRCCGCSNMTTVKDHMITAVDLTKVVMLNSVKEHKKSNVLTSEDLAFQEARRKRKVRKLDFEVR